MLQLKRNTEEPQRYAGGFPVVSLVIDDDEDESISGYAELWRVDVRDMRVTEDGESYPYHGFNLEISINDGHIERAYTLLWNVPYNVVDRMIDLAMKCPVDNPTWLERHV